MNQNPFLQSPFARVEQEQRQRIDALAMPDFQDIGRQQQSSGVANDLLPPPNLKPLFENAARRHGVPVNVLMAIAQQEPSYRTNAIGQPTQWGRAKGIMQYIDDTASRVGINPFEPEQAIDAAARQYAERIAKGYSHQEAIMAHHGGDNRRQWGPKTRAYGDQVMQKASSIGTSLTDIYGQQRPQQAQQQTQAPAPHGTMPNEPVEPMRIPDEQLPEGVPPAAEDARSIGTGIIDALSRVDNYFELTQNLENIGDGLYYGLEDMQGYMSNTLFMINPQSADTKDMAQRLADKYERMAKMSGRRTQQQKNLDSALKYVGEAEGFWHTAYAYSGAMGTAIMNPLAWGTMIAESAATAIPTFIGAGAGALGGAGVGTLVKPGGGTAAGAVIGGRTGQAAGSASIVAGEEMEHMIGKRLEAGNLDPTAANIQAILDDPDFQREARIQAAKAGLTYAAVEAVATKLAGSLAARPGRQARSRAAKKLSSELGISERAAAGLVDTRAGQTLVRELGPSLASRAGHISGGITISSAGEALGEAARQQVARGEIDHTDVAAEWIGSFGHAVAQTGIGYGFERISDAGRDNSPGRATGELLNRFVDGVDLGDPNQAAINALSPDSASFTVDMVRNGLPPAGPLTAALADANVRAEASFVGQQVDVSSRGQDEEPVTSERVEVTTPYGQVIQGTLEGYREDGQGGFQARILDDEGMVHVFTESDRVSIARGRTALPANEVAAINNWLDQIGETDTEARQDLIARAETNQDVRAALLEQARAATPERQDAIVRSDGKPFASAEAADRAMRNRRLADHQVIQLADGGWGIVPIQEAAQQQADMAQQMTDDGIETAAEAAEGMTDDMRWTAEALLEDATDAGQPEIAQQMAEVLRGDVTDRADIVRRIEQGRSALERAQAQTRAATQEKPKPMKPETGLRDMNDEQLQERIQYIVDQARANEGWSKALTDARREVEGEIARRAEVADEKPAAQIAPFVPTHELSDGTPVVAAEEPNTWIDAKGVEIQDNYATPITATPITQPTQEATDGLQEEGQGQEGQVSEPNFEAARALVQEQRDTLTTDKKAVAALKRKVRALAKKTPETDERTVSALDIVATRLDMENLEFAEAVADSRSDTAESETQAVLDSPSETQGDSLTAAPKDKFAGNKLFTSDKVEAARARLKSKLGQLNSGMDPEMLVDGMTLAGAYIEAGVRDFSQYASAMIEDFGDRIKPYLLSFYEGARNYPGLDSSGMSTVDEASKAHAKLMDGGVPASEKPVVGETVPKPKTRTRKTGKAGDRTLTQDWGVEHIDAYTTEGEQAKAAFLKESRTYLNAVRDALVERGYVPHEGKAKPVSVNEAGVAVSGDVSLTLRHPSGANVYATIGGTSLRGVVPTTASGVSVMFRASTASNDRLATKGQNRFAPTDLSAVDFAAMIDAQAIAITEREATDAVQSSEAVTGISDEGARAEGVSSDEAVGATGQLFDGADRADDGRNIGGQEPVRDGDSDAGRPAVSAGRADADSVDQQSMDGDRGTGDAASGGADRGARDYRIQPGELTRDRSWKEVAKRNVEIVELVKKIKAENRLATAEEKALLSKFTGWGASEIANGVFPDRYGEYKSGWKEIGERLQAALTEEEYAQAKRTTQYAHYTSEGVIRSIYGGMERLGFKGGNIVEPGMGVGLFRGLMPDGVAQATTYTGIEFDTLTGEIASLLYPQSNVIIGDFTKTSLPKDFFDASVGNPPFGSIRITNDPEYKKHGFMLHDYFFAKTIDRVKPGGILVFVTSKGTMDKGNDRARKYLAERANLLGAIRLPQTAFKDNAGTEVVTDVLFLQKRGDGIPDNGVSWLGTEAVKTKQGDARINEYFVAHPEMVLGEHAMTGSMYRADEYTVIPREGVDIEQAFAEAIQNLPESVYRAERGSRAEAAKVRDRDYNPDNRKEGGLYVDGDGTLRMVESGSGVEVTHRINNQGKAIALTDKQISFLRDYIGVRDALKQTQFDQLNDGAWEQSLAALNTAYDAFRKKHGALLHHSISERENPDGSVTVIKRFKNRPLLDMDVEGALAYAIEEIKDDGSITKGPALRGRTLKKPVEAQIATTHDAMFVTLNREGRLNIDTIAQLVGQDRSAVIQELGDLIYEDPGEGWVMADAYLSGNVVKKLKEAEAAARVNPAMKRNVEALKAVQPAQLSPSDISTQLGAHWVPASDIEAFASQVLGDELTVAYSPLVSKWEVTGDGSSISEWGIEQYPSGKIMDAVLNNRQIKVTYRDREGNTHTNIEATEHANQIAKNMRSAFKSWIWADQARTDRLVKFYNEHFNNIVPRQFDGRHLTLPGVSTRFQLRPHQKRAIWRVIQDGNTYMAHSVGAGKTFSMIAAGMEQRRLGLIRKPMYVVPNHMLDQFSKEFLELYPAANIMVADEQNFHKANRQRFVAQAALNDPDAIIITHSAFSRIGMSSSYASQFISRQIEEMKAVLSEVDNADRLTRKQIERNIENLERRLDAKIKAEEKDKVLDFEELGVDQLFVDEAHEFRKLDFATNLSRIKGIDPTGSQRSMDLFMKVQYLEQNNPGRSIVMASGTPVTNTMGELFTIQRFFQQDQMGEDGLSSFDAWANHFGEVVDAAEQNAAGGYEMVARFSKFVNVPDLMSRVRTFMDVLTSSQLGELVQRPPVMGGGRDIIITPVPDGFKEYQSNLSERIKAIRERKGPPSPGDDIILSVIGDGRFSAIDMRFVDPSLPSDPNSKLNRMLDDVIAAYHESADYEFHTNNAKDPAKGASMMVFTDLGLGEASARNRGFNMKEWITQRLVDGGVNPDHIGFMRDNKQHAKKLRLFEDMKQGRKRIMIGGKDMETGVNAQKRLKYLFHLDAPWFPASLEQREGRIIRQGNQNIDPGVVIKAYATKGSYDSTMWGMLARKQRFIEQAMTGDTSMRAMEDVSEASSFEMAAALASGDERYLKLAALKADVERLERLYSAHMNEQRSMHSKKAETQNAITMYSNKLDGLEASLSKRKEIKAGEFSGVVEGVTYDKRDDYGAALFQAFKARAEKQATGEHVVGKLGGFDVVFTGMIMKGSGDYIASLDLDIAGNRDALVTYPIDPNISVPGIATRAVNQINRIDNDISEARERRDQMQLRLAQIESRIGAEFAEIAELTEKRAELMELEVELSAESAETETTPDAPAFRRAEGAGMRVSPVRKAVETAIKSMSSPVAVHATPEAATKATGTEVYSDAKGFADGDQIHLIASNLDSEADAQSTLWHEVLHVGVVRAYGTRAASPYKRAMTAIANKNPNIRREAARWRKREGEDFQKALLDMGVPNDIVREQVQLRAIEEALADISGRQGEKINGLAEFIAKIQEWLRSVGLGSIAEWMESVGNFEALAFVRQMRAEVTGGVKQFRRSDDLPAFSRDANPDTIASPAKSASADMESTSITMKIDQLTRQIDSAISEREGMRSREKAELLSTWEANLAEFVSRGIASDTKARAEGIARREGGEYQQYMERAAADVDNAATREKYKDTFERTNPKPKYSDSDQVRGIGKSIQGLMAERDRAYTLLPIPESLRRDENEVVRLYHSGQDGLTRVEDGGIFQGIFALYDRFASRTGLDKKYYIDVPQSKILDHYALEYSIDASEVESAFFMEMPGLAEQDIGLAWRAVIEDRSDLVSPNDLMRIFNKEDAGEAGWEAQRIRGRVARSLGYSAVEMNDENGISVLVLPGVDVHSHDSEIRFSRSGTVAETTADSVAEALRSGETGAIIGSLLDSGRVVLHDTEASMPYQGGVRGVTMPDGTVHLNAQASNPVAVLLHEMLHAGAERLLGTRRWAELQSNLREIYTRMRDANDGKGNKFYQRAIERIKAAQEMGDMMSEARVVEEFGAYAIEEYASAPPSIKQWVDNLVGAVKAWLLEKWGIQAGDVTPAQLRAIAASALRDVASYPAESVAEAIRNDLLQGLADPSQPRLSMQERDAMVRQAQAGLRKAAGDGSADFDGGVIRDLGKIANLTNQPYTIASTNSDFTPVFLTSIDQSRTRDRIISDFYPAYRTYRDMKPESRKKINALMEYGRLTSQTFNEQDLIDGVNNAGYRLVSAYDESGKPVRKKETLHTSLSKKGETIKLDADEAGAYLGLRAMFDRALDRFRDQILVDYKLGELVGQDMPHLIIVEMAKSESNPARADRLMAIAQTVAEIEQAKRSGYVPFSRYGRYAITVKEKVADIQIVKNPEGGWIARDLTDDMADMLEGMGATYSDMEGGWSINAAQRQALMSESAKTVYSEKVEIDASDIPSAIAQAIAEGDGRAIESIPKVRDAIKRVREQWVGDNASRRLSVIDTQRKREEKGASLSDIDALADLTSLDEETWSVVREQFADAIKGRGFRRHFFPADNVPGYSTDFERATGDYIGSMASHLARRAHARQWDDTMSGIKGQRMSKYAGDYRKYFNDPQEEWSRLRQTGFLFYIAGNLSTALLNATQVAIMAVPAIAQASNLAVSTAEITRAYKDALKMTSLIDKGMEMFDPNDAPADVRADVQQAWNEGMFTPQFTREVMGFAGHTDKSLTAKYERMIEFISVKYTYIERLNRLVTFIAAARVAKRKGTQAKAERVFSGNALARHTFLGDNWSTKAFAEFMVNESQFLMGKHNRARMFRSHGAAIFQFMSFVMNSLQAWYRWSILHGKSGKLMTAASIAAIVALSGIWGTPGLDHLRDMYERLYKMMMKEDKDLRTDLRRYIADVSGSVWMAEVASKGALYPLGMDMSGRIGFMNIAPDTSSVMGALGIPADMLIGRPSRAIQRGTSGDEIGAVAELTPNFIKNPIQAYGWSKEGVMTMRGDTLLTPEQIPTHALWYKAAGVQPTIVTDVRDYTFAQRREQTAVDGVKRQFVDRISRAEAAAIRNEDPARQAVLESRIDAIFDELDAYNDRLIEQGKEPIRITPQNIRQRTDVHLYGIESRFGKERRAHRDSAEALRELFRINERFGLEEN